MRKLVITKKKKTEAVAPKKKGNKKLLKAAVLFTAVAIVAGGSISVDASGTSGEEQSVSYVYHKHIGSEMVEGGCYSQPVYHNHTGDETVGGFCYETPVYHAHAGTEISGGECYATVVYHVHEGNGNTAEGCYRAVTHSHSDDCYEGISSGEYGCHTLRTEDTDEDDYEGHNYKNYYMSCGQVVHGTNSSHMHYSLNCGRSSEVTGYELGCGKSQTSIESYELSCSKTDEIVDAYTLSCEKNTESIDGYERNCGKEEDIPYGKIVITKKPSEDEREADVNVQFEDLTGGELQLSETPFIWYDEQGNELGTGEGITVSENGTYSVLVGVINEDIREESLRAQVPVDSIKKPVASNDDNDREHDDDDDETEEFPDEGTEETPTAAPSETPIPVTEPTIPPAVPLVPSGNQTASLTDEEDSYKEKENKKIKESPAPTATPTVKKQTESAKIKERQSEPEIPVEVQTVKEKEGFFSSPLVKVLTVTVGTFAALTGLFILFYLLRWSVKIYNDDGQGKMIYLGRSMVKNEEDGYLICITEQMAEKAVTNRYCIRPGLFRVGRGEEELLIERGQKRISVSLQKEMLVII